MPEWNEENWDELLEKVRKKECTPVLGRYVLANGCNYPLNAAAVVQIASELRWPIPNPPTIENLSYFELLWSRDRTRVRRRISEILAAAPRPPFQDPNEPHRALAELPIPFYVTTTFDNWLFSAFANLQKDPKRKICKWWTEAGDRWDQPDGSISYVFKEDIPFKSATPIIFHLFGVSDHIHTMVLNEDDYFEFYRNTSGALGEIPAIPGMLDQKLGGSNGILLLGYRANDWDFKVVFNLLHRFMNDRSAHAAVQLQIDETLVPPEMVDRFRKAYGNYFESKFNISVYWGTCQEFVVELLSRWNERPDNMR